MPGSTYFFPKASQPPPQTPALLDFLSTNPSPVALARGLEEFAWRSLTDGKRVRTYCSEVSSLIDRLPASTTSTLRAALSSPALAALFPLIDLSPDPILPEAGTTVPSQLLPASTLLNLSRKQLIDVLSRVSRERSIVDGEVGGLRGQLLEVCLEYIGRRWRGGLERDEDVVDGISRKLTEIEFEIQLQGHPVTIRAIFLPIISSLRFYLGFVAASQLATRLNNIHNPTVRSNVSFDPHQLITAWLVARLRGGSEPQVLVDEVVEMRERLRTDTDKEALSEVLGSFGLLGRGRRVSDASILGQPGVLSPSTAPATSAVPAKSRLSLGYRPSLRRANAPSPLPPSARWWSHRRNNSSASRLHNLAPLINPDRRPSLPTISSPSFITTTTASPLGPYHTSQSSLGTNNSSTTRLPRDPASVAELLASLMTYDNPEDIRFILLDHLLGVRYRIAADQHEDWCLGQGKTIADETLTSIETRLVGRKDVMKLQPIFNDLRTIFDLSVSSTPRPTGYKPRRRSVVDQFPSVPPRVSMVSFASQTPEAPSSVCDDDESEASFSACGRGVSFDLDEYIMDITPIDGNSLDLDLGSALPSPTSTHGQQTPHRASMLSMFTIRQATREYAHETSATHIHLPRRVISLSELETASVSTFAIDENDSSSSGHSHGYYKASRSEPDLLEMLAALEMDDAPTDRSQLRRVSRMRGRSQVSARDLGISLPGVTVTPSLPPFHFNTTEEYHSTPIAIPTLPPIPRLASIPSIPSLDSHDHSQVMVNKNLAGLDTPPASPPLVDSSTITYSLSNASYRTTPSQLNTPRGKRDIHRQWAIVDGEHVSPPKDYPISVSGDDEDDDAESDYGTPGLDTPGTPRDAYITAPATPRPGAKAIKSLRSIPMLRSGQPASTELSLKTVIGLFDIADGAVTPRKGLADEDVRKVIKDIVNASDAGDEKGKWLLGQLADLLGDNFAPMIQYYLDNIIPLSPLLSPIAPIPRRNRPSALRHHTYPSDGSCDYPLTPPLTSPLSLYPESVADSEDELGLSLERGMDMTAGGTGQSVGVHARGQSTVTIGSMASTHTFGTPADASWTQ